MLSLAVVICTSDGVGLLDMVLSVAMVVCTLVGLGQSEGMMVVDVLEM
jgi:hypothetical protein